MPFQPGSMNYTQGFGSSPNSVCFPHIDVRAPSTQDIMYGVGQRWIDTVAGNEYSLTSFTTLAGVTTANWAFLGSSSGDLNSLTTDGPTIVTPTSGTILINGTTNQIATTGSNSPGKVVLSLVGPYTPATYTAHGVLIGEGTSSIVATAAGTAGQLLTSGGASADPTWTTATFPGTVAAGSLLVGTASNVVGALADAATGQVLMSGGVGVVPAYSGSPSVSGSITAGTTVTATLGDITATNGNFVSSTAGKGLSFNATTASGDASGPVVLNTRAGRVVFTSVSIAAAADLTLTMTNSAITSSSTQVIHSMDGATTGSALSVKSVTPGSGTIAFVITNGTGATTTTADIGINFLVVN